MESKEYTVTWKVQVSGSSPEAAARAARDMQRAYDKTAQVYEVIESALPENDDNVFEVDLTEGTVRRGFEAALPLYRTADGKPITVGGIYWDYDLELSRVTVIADHVERNQNTGEDVAWHRTESVKTGRRNGTFDGSRLVVCHPFTGQLAPDAAAAIRLPCTFAGCDAVFNPNTAGTDPGDGRGGILTGWEFLSSQPDEDEDCGVHDHTTA